MESNKERKKRNGKEGVGEEKKEVGSDGKRKEGKVKKKGKRKGR